jgi:hypothetical protein
MFRSRKPAVSFSVSIARDALESIFDDCDKFDADETGGRLLGTYRKSGSGTDVQVMGVLEAGPKAERSPVYFMQDGDYQEKLFRAIEEAHPEVEHLGNWHTHHVNGLQTLSGGDKTTYTKTVNHAKHNTDFFYALLVVRKNPKGQPRYQVKHFFFRRNDNSIYEVSPGDVRILDVPIYSARQSTQGPGATVKVGGGNSANPERVSDQQFFSDFYPGFKALLSKSMGAPYWMGCLPLVDGSNASVVAMESRGDGKPVYSITAASDNEIVAGVSAGYRERQFRSARHAVVEFERESNQAIYRGRKD